MQITMLTKSKTLPIYNPVVLAILTLVFGIASVLCFVPGVARAQTVTPIPAGCPGSTQQGPPAPGVCESIPLGCPGSTQQGPPAPGFRLEDCPYGVAGGNGGTGGNSGNAGGTSQPAYTPNDCNEQPVNKNNCGIVRYIVIFIQLLSGIASVVIVASIIYGGIQYSMAGSDPQKTASAKDRIRNAIIALVFFIFGFALLNFLVPGGVL